MPADAAPITTSETATTNNVLSTSPPPTPAPTSAPSVTKWRRRPELAAGNAYGFSFLFGNKSVLLGGASIIRTDENGNHTFIPTDEAYGCAWTGMWSPLPSARLPLPMWGYFAHLNGREDLLVTAMSSSQRMATEPRGFVYFAETDDPSKGLVWERSTPLQTAMIGLPVRRRAGFFSVMDVVIFIGGVDVNKTYQPEIISFNRTSRRWAIDTIIPKTDDIDSVCDCQVQVLRQCLVSAICNECDIQTNHSGGGNRRLTAINAVYDPCRKKISSPTVLPFNEPIVSFDTTRVGHYLVSMVGLVTQPPPRPTRWTSTTTEAATSTAPTTIATEAVVGDNASTEDSTLATTIITTSTASTTEESSENTTDGPNGTTTRPPRPTPSPDENFRVVLYYTDLFNLQQYMSTNEGLQPRFGGSLLSEGPMITYAGGFRDLSRNAFSSAVDMAQVVPSIYLSLDRATRFFRIGEEIAFKTESFHEGMSVRLALSPQCTFAVPGTSDAVVSRAGGGNGVGTLGNVTYAAENLYLCVSNGVCNQNTATAKLCRTHASQANFESCLSSRCCWVNNACYEYEAGEGQYFMLASPTTPITVLPVPPVPEEDTTNRFLRFFTSVGGIILLVFCAVALVIMSLILTIIVVSRRSRAKMSSLNEEDEAHALEPSGKYKVVRKLGQGGFGSVFLVKRRSDGKELALKHMICPSAEERDYAIKEFQLLHNAQGHENMIHLEEMLINWGVDHLTGVPPDAAIVQVGINADPDEGGNGKNKKKGKGKKGGDGGSEGKALLSDDGNPLLPLLKASSRYVCIVMEYCEEGDLARLMLNTPKYRRGLPEKMIIGYANQICSLLMHLHSRDPPIVHRDLKPENVLLKKDATQVVLTDFGLAQQLERSYMTTRAGTLHFIAPECWKKHYTATVDMWSLGCILWACCTGRVTNSTARVMFKDARSPTFEVEINHELRDYSKLLRRVVIGLLKIKTDHRLTAQQALDLLKQWRDPSVEERSTPYMQKDED